MLESPLVPIRAIKLDRVYLFADMQHYVLSKCHHYEPTPISSLQLDDLCLAPCPSHLDCWLPVEQFISITRSYKRRSTSASLRYQSRYDYRVLPPVKPPTLARSFPSFG